MIDFLLWIIVLPASVSFVLCLTIAVLQRRKTIMAYGVDSIIRRGLDDGQHERPDYAYEGSEENGNGREREEKEETGQLHFNFDEQKHGNSENTADES